MKRFNWQILLGLSLIALSAFFYLIHYAIFRDAHHIFIYMIGDIAFVPIEVLLVTLIIHQLLSVREKRSMLKKLNMVIGAFFSEVGTRLLESFSEFDTHPDTIRKDLIVSKDWSSKEFSRAIKHLKKYDYSVDSKKGNLEELQRFLADKRDFLLGLLENPNLLEHESFTELLWAVFHLTEELSYRKDVNQLPNTDYQHLSGDIKRTYVLLLSEWMVYMKHLKTDYPYLFSFSLRTNPFDPSASPEVR
ncbi:MAG: hypothetical protein JRF22_06105 [Deltaproteobacteria bacterium]|jgi:hypothetical protein|nr:hypothetical protein [Deltaproteobacteria bacterium]